MTLRVIVQIIPFGDEDKAREIGRIDIFNKQQIDYDEYEYGVIELNPKQEGLYNDTISHHRHLGAWKLIRKALETFDIR